MTAVTKAGPRSGHSGHGGHSNSVKQPPGGPEVQPVLFLLGGGGQGGSIRWAIITAMAAKNKCLAENNKSCTARRSHRIVMDGDLEAVELRQPLRERGEISGLSLARSLIRVGR